MKVTKDKQFLIFTLPSGKSCRYDLSTGYTYGFSGKRVKSINTQLKGYTIFTIINSIEEKPYREFLSYIRKYYAPYVSNFGSLLLIASKHREAEQYFTAGISLSRGFTHNISEIPKGLIKLCKENNIALNNKLYNVYIQNPDRIHSILNLELNSLSPQKILDCYIEYNGFRQKIDFLLDEYNYSFKSLFHYIDDLYTYEALTNSIIWVVQELYDYVRQSSTISLHYEKYPRHFLSTLPIVRRNYDRLKIKYDEKEFKSIYSKISPLYEKHFKDYSFIYPKTIQDIKDEAIQQHNCVASYINRVINHECHIMFMRENKSLDKSLLTLEIINDKIVQARGPYNRLPTPEEREVIKKWELSVA